MAISNGTNQPVRPPAGSHIPQVARLWEVWRRVQVLEDATYMTTLTNVAAAERRQYGERAAEGLAALKALVRGWAVELAYGREQRMAPRDGVHRNPGSAHRSRDVERMSDDVLAVVYVHDENGKLYVHGFGDADLDLTTHRDGALTIARMAKERTGIVMEAHTDGSITMRHEAGKPIHGEFT